MSRAVRRDLRGAHIDVSAVDGTAEPLLLQLLMLGRPALNLLDLCSSFAGHVLVPTRSHPRSISPALCFETPTEVVERRAARQTGQREQDRAEQSRAQEDGVQGRQRREQQRGAGQREEDRHAAAAREQHMEASSGIDRAAGGAGDGDGLHHGAGDGPATVMACATGCAGDMPASSTLACISPR